MRTVRLTQCYDVRFIDGTAIELEVFENGRTVGVYVVGQENEFGCPMVVAAAGPRPPKPWLLSDDTVLDLVEEFQSGAGPCAVCEGDGLVDVYTTGTSGSVHVDDCDACDGAGWRRA